MSDELKAVLELADKLGIIGLLIFAWTAERRERREIQAKLDESNKAHAEAQAKAHAEAIQLLKDCIP